MDSLQKQHQQYLIKLRELASEVSLLLLVLSQSRAVQPAAVAVQTGLHLLLLPPLSLLLVPLVHQSLKSIMIQST